MPRRHTVNALPYECVAGAQDREKVLARYRLEDRPAELFSATPEPRREQHGDAALRLGRERWNPSSERK